MEAEDWLPVLCLCGLCFLTFSIGACVGEDNVRQEALDEGHAHRVQKPGEEGYQFEWINHEETK